MFVYSLAVLSFSFFFSIFFNFSFLNPDHYIWSGHRKRVYVCARTRACFLGVRGHCPSCIKSFLIPCTFSRSWREKWTCFLDWLMCNTLYTEAYQSSLKYFSKLSHNTHMLMNWTVQMDSLFLYRIFFSPCLKGQVVEGVGGVGG